MKRHEVEPVSLVAGLLLLLVAAGFAVSNTTDVHLRWVLVVPVVLIVAGAAILAALARRIGRQASDRATIDDDADLPGTS